MYSGYYGNPYGMYQPSSHRGHRAHGASHAQWEVVSGKVVSSSSHGMAFTGNEILEVSVVDASRMDAPSVVLGRQQIQLQPTQGFPIRFQFYYDKSRAGPGFGGEIMQARITNRNGQLLYINDTRTPLTSGVKIDVRPV